MPRLVLASGSPRRQELLGRLGLAFTVRVPDVDETPRPGEGAVAYVERLARAKAVAPPDTRDAERDGEVVLAADTIVELDGALLGKPAGPDAARAMLGDLSGRTHRVHTGVAVAHDGAVSSQVTTTEVTFRVLTADDIEAYLASGEPFDKAGAYAIQGRAGSFVASVAGSVSNVVGLPLAQTAALLAEAGLAPLTWGPPRS